MTSKNKQLSDVLRKLLHKIEEQDFASNATETLLIEIQQKERLKVTLHSLLTDLNDKIMFVQNCLHEQSMKCSRTPKTEVRKKRKFWTNLISSKSAWGINPRLSTPSYSIGSYKWKQYKVINPSEIELKNLIPKGLRNKIKRLGESLFQIKFKKFKFLRDEDGNTYVEPQGEEYNLDLMESQSTYTWASTEKILPVHKFVKGFKRHSKRKVKRRSRFICPTTDNQEISTAMHNDNK